ncbi:MULTISPECIES: AI-2E family transporter [Falsihalocynthiibacter]|uniref:AI-2E family transporter n=1 Tax=Falsihalocynthiibacter TaxID=2854182 RepID=UPI003003A672
MGKTDDARIVDLVVRLVFLGLFIYSAIVMVAPLASVVIWAVILCVALYPLYTWLEQKLGGRKSLASGIIVLLGLALTLGPVGSAISGAIEIARNLSDQATAGTLKMPPAPEGLKDLPLVGGKLSEVWSVFEKNLGDALRTYGPQITEVGMAIFGRAAGIGMSLLGLALSVIVMGFLFSPGPKLSLGVQGFANRVFAPRGGEFVVMAGATIKNVTKGVIGVAAIQAVCVWVLLALFGIQSAATLALICLILSIIQLGPMIVLIPVAIYAWSSMSGGAALAFTVLAIPVGIMDGFLRPIFISKGLQTPMLVILIGVIGGMMAYGLIGVFMGPVLLAVFYELFTLWLASDADETVKGEAE